MLVACIFRVGQMVLTRLANLPGPPFSEYVYKQYNVECSFTKTFINIIRYEHKHVSESGRQINALQVIDWLRLFRNVCTVKYRKYVLLMLDILNIFKITVYQNTSIVPNFNIFGKKRIGTFNDYCRAQLISRTSFNQANFTRFLF